MIKQNKTNQLAERIDHQGFQVLKDYHKANNKKRQGQPDSVQNNSVTVLEICLFYGKAD